jgi:hypothetical protein
MEPVQINLQIHRPPQQISASHTITYKVARKCLHLHLYKVTNVHELKEMDQNLDVQYCW